MKNTINILMGLRNFVLGAFWCWVMIVGGIAAGIADVIGLADLSDWLFENAYMRGERRLGDYLP